MPSKDEMIKAVREYLESIKVSDKVIEDEISDENLEASYELIQKHPDMMILEYYMRRTSGLTRGGKLPEPIGFIGLLPRYNRWHRNTKDDSDSKEL